MLGQLRINLRAAFLQAAGLGALGLGQITIIGRGALAHAGQYAGQRCALIDQPIQIHVSRCRSSNAYGDAFDGVSVSLRP